MYNNIPSSSSAPVATQFSGTYETQFSLESNTFTLMKGFFEGKGFDKLAAETIAVSFIKQATADGYNPLEVLDSLKTLSSLEINSVITDILNFNRYKTSYLGNSQGLVSFEPISRNIVA